jgi:hypothetical protein
VRGKLAMARWLAAIAKGLNGRRKEARTTTQGQEGKRVGFKELHESIPMADHEQSRREECALGPDHRCLVPFASFAEHRTIDGKKVPMCFAPNVGRRLNEDQKLLKPRQVLRFACSWLPTSHDLEQEAATPRWISVLPTST